MRLLDEKFGTNKTRYILQCLLAVLAVFLVLLILDAKKNSIVIAALGASSFIVFTMPHRRSCRARFLIGGYVVGVISGFVCFRLSKLSCDTTMPPTRDYAEGPQVRFAGLRLLYP
jgi:CBS-domain-containing membrane protein